MMTRELVARKYYAPAVAATDTYLSQKELGRGYLYLPIERIQATIQLFIIVGLQDEPV